MTAAVLDDDTAPLTPLTPPTRRPAPRAGHAGPSTGPGRQGRRRFADNTTVGQWHIRANARRPGPGPELVLPTVAELVPAGFRPVLNRAEALARFDQLPGTAWLYANSYATRRAVWQALVEHMDPETGLIVAGQALIAARASVHAGKRIARATAGNHLRALADEQSIGVETGASKEALNSARDRASVYVLLAPLVDEPAVQPDDDVELTAEQLAEVDRLAARLDELAQLTPRSSAVDNFGHLPEGSAPTRTQEITQPRKDPLFSSSAPMPPGATGDTSAQRVLGRSGEERPGTVRREHPERFNPRTGPEREIAVAWISAIMGWTSTTSRFAALRTERELRKISGPCFAAGWSPAAVVKAFTTKPDGSPWNRPLKTPDQRDSGDQPRIRNQWAVLTHRIAAWRDPLGNFMDPPIPTERPRRGRPRKQAARAAAPPAASPARSAEVEVALAARRAQLAQLAADRSIEQQARASRRERNRDELAQLFTLSAPDEAPSVREVDPAELRQRRAVFRARAERRPSRQ